MSGGGGLTKYSEPLPLQHFTWNGPNIDTLLNLKLHVQFEMSLKKQKLIFVTSIKQVEKLLFYLIVSEIYHQGIIMQENFCYSYVLIHCMFYCHSQCCLV